MTEINKLLINDLTFKEIENINSLPQSVLLTGVEGVGLLTIAKAIAGKDFAGLLHPTNKDGEIDQIRGSISVDTIRDLQLSTRSKSHRRVIIIDDAEKMTQSAQNSFLKLLEEPPKGTIFILTSHHYHNLLPTVLSRTHRLTIRKIEPIKTNHLVNNLFKDSKTQQQIAFIASGLPAQIHRLAKNKILLESTINTVSEARQFLGMNSYQKLTHIMKINKSKEDSLAFIKSLEMILMHQSMYQPQENILLMLDNICDVHESINLNYNLKAQMLKLIL